MSAKHQQAQRVHGLHTHSPTAHGPRQRPAASPPSRGQSGPCRCPRWVRHGVHAGDRLGIPAPDTATTDQGREAGRWGRPTLQSTHAAYASHTFLCGRPRPQAVSRSGQRMQGRFGASASPVGSRVGAQHPQSRIRHLLCLHHLSTSGKPSRCPCGFTVDRMGCLLWAGEG